MPSVSDNGVTGPLRIATPQALAEGMAALVRLEPAFAALAQTPPPLRLARPGLAAMLTIIGEQSISRRAAAAIMARLGAAMRLDAPASVLACEIEQLRALGLTRTKARAFHATAAACRDGLFTRLEAMADDRARRALTALPGIGPWSAEIYLLSCLGRADAWPAGDVALQTAAATLFALPQRPDGRQLEAMAEAWRPWRAVAARLLWASYRRDATAA